MTARAPIPADFNPLRLGLEPVALEDWLRPRAGDGDILEDRARLATERPGAVLGLLNGGAAAVTELADMLRDRGPTATHGPLPDAAARDLLAILAGTVAEDLLFLTPDGADDFILTAAVLCFPNRWRLTEKMGRGLTAIHGPVPEYAEALATPVDRFLARLRPGRAFVRSNWGLSSSPALHLPDPVPTVDPESEDGFFREEQQGFVKLAASGAVVFSIRTTVTPWALVADPVRAAVRAAAKDLSPAWRAYKSLPRVKPAFQK